MSSLKNQLKEYNKRRFICSAVAGSIIAICLICGFCIENWKAVPYTDIRLYLTFFVGILLMSGVVYVLFVMLDGKQREHITDRKYTFRQKILRIAGYAGVILAGWMPSFLGVYPGWFNYDAPWQLSMFQNNAISAHHPVLHTVIMGWILEFMADINGTYNKGIALYLLLQMCVLALCFGYVVYFMGKKGIGRIGRGVSLIWFILFPPIVLHAMSTTKDTLFTGFLVVLVIFTYELLENPTEFLKRKCKVAGWVLLVFMCIVFRQNTLYVFCIMAIPVLVILRKYWKAITGMFAGVIVLYLLYVGPFYTLLNVQSGSKAEFLSVPCQQMVRVYLEEKDNLSQEEVHEIEYYFSQQAFELYRPKIADYTKGNLDMERLGAEGSRFWKLYGSLFMKYPAMYVDAFFLNNYGFWYPDATVDIYIDGVSYYFASEHVPPSVQNSKIPFLLRYYKSFYTDFPVQDAGLLTWVLSMATYFYILLITTIYLIYQKRKAGVVTCLIILLIWLTYLLGPVALTRYVLFLFVLPPIEYILISRK